MGEGWKGGEENLHPLYSVSLVFMSFPSPPRSGLVYSTEELIKP